MASENLNVVIIGQKISKETQLTTVEGEELEKKLQFMKIFASVIPRRNKLWKILKCL